jgi:hypothetical protein
LTIKAIFLDLDGTLLNGAKQITPKTFTALQKCRAVGVKLFIATARPPLLSRMLDWDEATVALFDGGIYFNGGLVAVGDMRQYTFIDEAVVSEAAEQVYRYGNVNFLAQSTESKHIFRYGLNEQYHKDWGIYAYDMCTFEQVKNFKAVKLLAFHEDMMDTWPALDVGLVERLRGICDGRACIYVTDNGRLVQITGLGVNKLAGVETVRGMLGLSADEVAVFGDDTNDAEMLAAYKYGFAMGNASDEVKAAANFVTLDNESDGVWHALANILRIV